MFPGGECAGVIDMNDRVVLIARPHVVVMALPFGVGAIDDSDGAAQPNCGEGLCRRGTGIRRDQKCVEFCLMEQFLDASIERGHHSFSLGWSSPFACGSDSS